MEEMHDRTELSFWRHKSSFPPNVVEHLNGFRHLGDFGRRNSDLH